MTETLIHRHQATAAGTPVNAYLVEGPSGVVAVDATLAVASGRALRARADALSKPLLGVVLTHVHPDHYGGLAALTDGLDIPVFSTRLVHDVVRRDDPVKEAILRPMFGDLWALERAFPTEVVQDGATIDLGGVALTVRDLGPGESPADSFWFLEREPTRVFSADLAYDRTHAYLADGFYVEWLTTLEQQRQALPAGATLHPGHGDPVGLEALDYQRRYIEAFLDAAGRDAGAGPEAHAAAVASAMRRFLPTEELAFLMELSVGPVTASLAAAA